MRESIVRWSRPSRTKLAQFDSITMRERVFHVLDSSSTLHERAVLPSVMPVLQTIASTVMSSINLVLAVVIVCATIPGAFDPSNERGAAFFAYIGGTCVTMSMVLWVVRCICAPTFAGFIVNVVNLFDVATLVMFWVDVARVIPPGVAQSMLILRLTLVMRAMVMLRDFSVVVATTARRSLGPVLLLGILLLTAIPRTRSNRFCR